MPQLIALNNARVYAPEFLGVRSLLVGGGKILQIAEQPFTATGGMDLQIVDLDGKLLLPGLIDCHAHITGGGGEAGFATQVPPLPLSDYTKGGITSVIGLLGTDDCSRSTENLVARTYALREEGLSAWCWTGGYHLPLTTLAGSARRDIVFVDPIIGIGEFAISDHRSSQPNFDEFCRLASEAHVAGLMTGKAGVLHCHLGDGSRRLELIERAIRETELPPRTFHPTHVNRNKALFESACTLMENGVTVDITAFPAGSEDPGYSAFTALQKIVEAGLPLSQVTISSDGGGCMPCFNSQGELCGLDYGRSETLLQTLQQCANQPQLFDAALRAVTSNVAQALRLPAKGKIKAGCDADIIVVDEKLSLDSLMAGGRWHIINNSVKISGTFERG